MSPEKEPAKTCNLLRFCEKKKKFPLTQHIIIIIEKLI